MRHSRLLALLISLAGTSCTDKTDADYRADVIVSIRDAEAITAMREAWKRARTAYEHVEGAVVSLFPGVDVALDARYEEMLAKLGPAGDPDPFDGRGVT